MSTQTKKDQRPSEATRPPALPWVKINQGTTKEAGLPAGFHALFAARICPRPFEEIAKGWQWGFNAAALLQEAQERQRLFIESQATATGRTLALRCLHRPGDSNLKLLLLGKVQAEDAAAARAAALEYWRELQAIFPYDYSLTPITNELDFNGHSGQALLERVKRPEEVVEIRRFEEMLSTGRGYLYLLGEWRATPTANEQVWRALAACDRPVLLNVALQPTILDDVEQVAIEEMAAASQQALTDCPLPLIRADAQWSSGLCSQRLTAWRQPYLVQLHLVTPGGVPEYLVRAVGSAMSQTTGRDQAAVPYRSIRVHGEDCLARQLAAIRWLEPDYYYERIPDPRFIRLPFLMGSQEAHVPFRFPFPHKGGIPGVSFA